MYADIIVDISQKNIDRPFSYEIPEGLLDKCAPGVCVSIPFGAGNREITGYIVDIKDTTDVPLDKIKQIKGIVDNYNTVDSKLIALASWMRRQYGSTMITALKTVLPVKKKYEPKEKKTILLKANEMEAMECLSESIRKHQTGKEKLIRELMMERVLDYGLVTGKLHVSASTINSLCKAGIIAVNRENYFRNPVRVTEDKETAKTLNADQQRVVDEIAKDYQSGIRKTYLIRGVTGSGKTEVYIRLIKEVVREGKQVIVLIPEISLTYQTLIRFYHHFGERVSVMNSTLSAGEKYDQFERAKNGEIDVIIGPRSALFTPFPDLGLIVIDEEHEPSYKSETMPRYHAREVAKKLAQMNHASVILGSATPSIESYYHAQNGDYGFYKLENRALGNALPNVYITDLREELKSGNRSIFGRKLQELLENRLQKGQQSMLFLNRRGLAGFISCRSCGEVIKCPHCDVSLSEHKNGKLVCHYCGYETVKPNVCPKCGSKYILSFRAGTEQIEEQLKKMYPTVRVLRMDADTTRKKESYEKLLTQFANGEADVLVGTQMIVKGHDFPNVTLMGVLAADLSLAAGDFRAGERTFQLLTQAAGRAGRGNQPGEVVIQTYQPDHYSVVHAAKQDYEGFYEEELLYRDLGGYPPIYQVMAVMIMSKVEEIAAQKAKAYVTQIQEQCNIEADKSIMVIGPAPAGIGKINDYYRYVFYIKGKEKESLLPLKEIIEKTEYKEEKKDYQLQIDFNPMNPF